MSFHMLKKACLPVGKVSAVAGASAALLAAGTIALAFTGPGLTAPGSGSGRVSVDESGNIGYGTSTLYTAGGVGVGTSTAPTGNKLEVWGGNAYVSGSLTAGGTVTGGSSVGPVSSAYVSAGIFGSSSTKGNYTFQAAANTNPILFVDATNERVGIGTASPNRKLDIMGAVGASVDIGLLADLGNQAADYWILKQLASDNSFRILSGGKTWPLDDTNSAVVTMTTIGNVGIGTASPTSTLTVAGTVWSTSGGFKFPDNTTQTTAFGGGTQVTSAAYVSAGTFGSSSTKGNYRFDAAASANPILFVDATNERVGIGTASPGNYRLNVPYSTGNYAPVEFNGPGTAAWGTALVVRTTGGTDGAGILFRSRDVKNWQIRGETSGTGFQITEDGGDASYGSGFGTPRLHISAGGNVGIGTAVPGAKLEVAGTVKITGGTPGTGKVLTSDAAGLASWTTPTSGTITGVTAGNQLTGGGTSGTVTLNVSEGAGSGLDADLLDNTDTSAVSNRWGVIPIVGTDGVMEVGKYTDFHSSDADAGDFENRITSSSGLLSFSGSGTFGGTISATGGNSTNWNTAYGWGNHASAGYAPLASPVFTGTPSAQGDLYAYRFIDNNDGTYYIDPNNTGVAGMFAGRIDVNGNEIEVQGTQNVTAPFIRFHRPSEEYGQIRYGKDGVNGHNGIFAFRNMNASTRATIEAGRGSLFTDGLTSGSIDLTYGVYADANGQNKYGVYGVGANGADGVYGSMIGTAGAGIGAGVRGAGLSTGFDFYAGGPGTDYGVPSSIRWKKNIKEIPNALDTVMNLRGVSFDWDAEHGGERMIGFVGEEIAKYYPEIVEFDASSSDPSYYVTGMDYSKMTPILLQAIKELKEEKDAEIADLKAEIEELKRNR